MLFKKKKEDSGLDDTSFVDEFDVDNNDDSMNVQENSTEDMYDGLDDAPEIQFHHDDEDTYEDEYEEDDGGDYKPPVKKIVFSIVGVLLAILLFGGLAFFAIKGFGDDAPKEPEKKIEKPITNTTISVTEETQKVRIVGVTPSKNEVYLYDGAGKVKYSTTLSESKNVALSEIIPSHEGGVDFYGFDKTSKTVYKLTFNDDNIKRIKLGEIQEAKDITDVVSAGSGVHYVATGTNGLWKIDGNRKATKIINEPVDKFDINKGFILYSSGNGLATRAIAGGNSQKLDMKSPTEAIVATQDSFLVLSSFGSGLDNSIAMYVKPSTLGTERIIELKDKGLNVCGLGSGKIFVEQDGTVKELSLNEKKPLRSFRKDKKTKDIVCLENSVYERDTNNLVTYKTLDKKDADLGDFTFTGAKMYIFGK